MKTKRLLVAVSITALILIIIFVSLKAYYVAIAFIVGMLIMGHREWWSLIKKRRLPPADERVRGNINKSIRNSFIFFATVLVLTILFYTANSNDYYTPLQPDLSHYLGGLLLSVGTIYLLSYIFYDRVEDNLDKRGLKIFKTSLLISGISLGVFIIIAFFPNTIPRINIDYMAVFRISFAVLPLVFAAGIIGSLVVLIKGLFTRSS